MAKILVKLCKGVCKECDVYMVCSLIIKKEKGDEWMEIIEKLKDFIRKEYERIDNIYADDNLEIDGEEIFDQGRWQGQFEELKAIEKILEEHK